MNLLVWLLSGIIAGWLAGLMIRGSGFGLLGDLVVGLIGGLVGGFLAGALGVQATSWPAHILVAALGGVVFVWVLHLIHPGTVGT
jgi:uncharacterized membrane protein YeaQ/YmgE (transglycosylase-associated protein family)